MSVRYLRRPMKARATAKATKGANVTPGTKIAGAVPIDVTREEREQLAYALAYFCVACGREHASGDVRGCDIARAEADIVAVIRRSP